jgi:hypothetical protein
VLGIWNWLISVQNLSYFHVFGDLLDVIKPSQALRFQDWLVYESSLNSRARTQAKLWNLCSSSTRLKLVRARARAQARLLNFSMCNQSGVQARVCKQPIYIY